MKHADPENGRPYIVPGPDDRHVGSTEFDTAEDLHGKGSEPVTDRVPAGDGCPACGEDRVDWLVIDAETELVTCTSCGGTYSIQEGL